MTCRVYNKDGSIKETWIQIDNLKCENCKHSEKEIYNKTVTKLIDDGKITGLNLLRCKNRILLVYNMQVPNDWFCKYFEEKK